MLTHDPDEEVIVQLRAYNIALNNATPGLHTIRMVLRVSQTTNDGFSTIQAGTYEKITRFTVEGAPPAEAAGMPRTGAGTTWELPLLGLLAGLALVATGQALLKYRANKP